MKYKLIFSTLIFFSVTFCHAQKLTPEILHGQWQVIAFYKPNEIFYNSFTDSFSVENKTLLKDLERQLKNDNINMIAYDSLKRRVKSDIQRNILSFDESGNMIMKLDVPKPPVFLFSEKKSKFRAGDYGPANTYLDVSYQNGLLMVTISDRSTSRTVWAKKNESNAQANFVEVKQYLADSIAPNKGNYVGQPFYKLLAVLKNKIVGVDVDGNKSLPWHEPKALNISSVRIRFFGTAIALLNNNVPSINVKFSKPVSIPQSIFLWGKAWDNEMEDFYKDIIVQDIEIFEYSNKVAGLNNPTYRRHP